MTNYIFIVLPIVYGYVMQNFCPFVDSNVVIKRKEELAKSGLNMIYDVVWPLLFVLVGFSWYFAKDTSILLKGTTKTIGPSTMLDSAYVVFTLFLGWWMVVNTCTTCTESDCTSDKRNQMFVLFLTSVVGVVLLYLITSHNRGGLFALIPVVMWLFFTNEFTVRDYLTEIKGLATPDKPLLIKTSV